jgi:hypothetical protein
MIGQTRRPGADTAVTVEPETTEHSDHSLCAAMTTATLRPVAAPNGGSGAARNYDR